MNVINDGHLFYISTEISRGDVMFSKVGNLCYIDTVLWRDIFSSENSTVKYDTLSIEQATPCKGFILAFIQIVYLLLEVIKSVKHLFF